MPVEEPVIGRRRLLYAGFGLAAGSVLVPRFLRGFQPPWRDTVADSKTIKVGGAALQVDFGAGDLDLSHDAVVLWVRRAAEAVSHYYGRFPVSSMRVLVLPSSGRGCSQWNDVGECGRHACVYSHPRGRAYDCGATGR